MRKPARRFAGREAAVPAILVALLLDGMAIGMIAPVLPARVAAFTADRAAQSYWVGALAVGWGLMHFIAAPVLGALSDRFGRRPVLLASIAGLAIDLEAMALAPSIWAMLAGRLVGGLTAAGFLVGSAYVADVTPAERRSRSMGLLGAAVGIGLIVGPVVGGLLGEIDARWPFHLAAALACANGLYVAFALPESLAPGQRAAFSLRRANPLSALLALRTMRAVAVLVAVFGLVKFAQFVLQNVWVLYTSFRFGWGPRDSGIALLAVGVAAALAQGVLLRPLLRRLGERRTAIIGLASGALAMALFGAATQGWMMYVIVAASLPGLTAAPALQGMVSKAYDASRQGVAMGALQAVGSLMAVLAPLVGAPLLGLVSHLPRTDWRVGAPFYLAAAAMAAGLALALATHRQAGRAAARGVAGQP